MRSIRAALIPVLASVVLASVAARASTVDQTYYFTGVCSDCTGDSHGTLVLQNYSDGSWIDNSNFVSFDYSSNLTTLSITSTDLSYVSGQLGPAFPAAYNFIIDDTSAHQFYSSGSGYWTVSAASVLDTGDYSSWNDVAATPLPATLPLLASGLVGFAWLARRKKQRIAAQG